MRGPMNVTLKKVLLELCKSSNIWEQRVLYRKIYWCYDNIWRSYD